MRLVPALLACALAALAQDTAAPARNALIDVIVTDAAGGPVSNLTASDFEVTEEGKPLSVVRLTAFDTVRHTAVSAGNMPALDLTPEQHAARDDDANPCAGTQCAVRNKTQPPHLRGACKRWRDQRQSREYQPKLHSQVRLVRTNHRCPLDSYETRSNL